MKKSPPAAPPVYKPQPRAGTLQQKRAAAAPTPFKRTTAAPKAPPVYRPNQPPAVLQKKAAPGARPNAPRPNAARPDAVQPNAVQPNAAQPTRRVAAPPVYRPETKAFVQRKAASVQASKPQAAPAVRTAPQAQGVLQRKSPQAVSSAREWQMSAPPSRPPSSARQGGRPAAPWTAQRANVVQRSKARQAEAKFLLDTTRALFDATDDGKLMEVQSAIFDGRMFVASNYSRGADDAALGAVMAGSYSHGGKTYRDGSLVRLADALHAEQQILKELAKVIKNPNKANPNHVTVVGTKRPCSVCRRALLAFNKALLKHYPEVHLHFVDQTGKDTDVAALDLSELKEGGASKFNDFVDTYTAELENYGRARLSGEEVSNGVRTVAAAALDDIL
jgi:tRNA(Arg) A34 adenosine deaminase TadA